MIRVEMERTTGDYGFEVTDSLGHKLLTDSSSESGGADSGYRPMQLLLAALGSCSAIDVISILLKQRQTISHFKIIVEGERRAEGPLSLWKTIHVQFELAGLVDAEKAGRAAELSVQKYCSVAETLRRAGATITWAVKMLQPQTA